MKNALIPTLIVMMVAFVAFICIGCGSKKMSVEAEVLSINCEILEGHLISHFLAGSSGSIRGDTIKIGVSFKIKDVLFLRDLKLNHAQLAYYRDRNTLPLKIKIEGYEMLIRLNDALVDELRLSRKLRKKLMQYD